MPDPDDIPDQPGNGNPPLPPSQVMLQGKALTRRAAEKVLLDNVSLSIHTGDRIAVVGASGSGKTLLLRSLSLLDSFDEGELIWHGTSIQDDQIPRFRSRVIYLHQQPVLGEGTVEESLREPFLLQQHRSRQFDEHFHRERLRQLGRDPSFLRQSIRNLSGGETQIVALLRAIQLAPEILLLDEPTSALDAASAEAVETLINNWLDEDSANRALLLVTHNQTQAARMATRILSMKAGRLDGEDG